jgi:hypothetical protein
MDMCMLSQTTGRATRNRTPHVGIGARGDRRMLGREREVVESGTVRCQIQVRLRSLPKDVGPWRKRATAESRLRWGGARRLTPKTSQLQLILDHPLLVLEFLLLHPLLDCEYPLFRSVPQAFALLLGPELHLLALRSEARSLEVVRAFYELQEFVVFDGRRFKRILDARTLAGHLSRRRRSGLRVVAS